MTLPRILAGPALRRTDREAVWIWLCTSAEVEVRAEIHRVDGRQRGALVGRSRTETVRHIRLGQNLHIYLIKTVPHGPEFFPARTVLTYQLIEQREGAEQPLGGYDENQFGVGVYPFPTFVIQRRYFNELRALFGSCRKMHGDGGDATEGMLHYLQRHLVAHAGTDAERLHRLRPTALFLLGDQIYADDVSSLLTLTIGRLADELRPNETLPLSSVDDPRGSTSSRQRTVARHAGFTSDAADFHLLRLGEYAAAYLLAWNESDELWPDFSTAPVANLRNAKNGSGAMRKLLANIPTYMMLDDHDVTDDWNINPSWVRHVRTKPLGMRVITNALVAYWAFQGWGNDPDHFDDEFLNLINQYLSDPPQHTENTFLHLNSNSREDLWSFTTPTRPAAVFLDFRTHRTANTNPSLCDATYSLSQRPAMPDFLADLDPPVIRPHNRMRETRLGNLDLGSNQINGMAPRLFNLVVRRRALHLLRPLHGQPLILVTGTPVVGSRSIDAGQELGIVGLGTFFLDFESWRADPESLLNLYELIREAKPSVCAILSGDVHFGFCFTGSVSWPGPAGMEVNLGQFTSSSFKNHSWPGFVMGLASLLANLAELFGEGMACRWLYCGRAAPGYGAGRSAGMLPDGTGVPTGRIVASSLSEIRHLGQNDSYYQWVLERMRQLIPGIGDVYCDETWQLHRQNSGGGYIDETNFGVLVASDEDYKIFSVHMHNWAGNPLGDQVRLAAATSHSSPGFLPVLYSPNHRSITAADQNEMTDVITFAKLCVESYQRMDMSRPISGYMTIRGDVIIDGHRYVNGELLTDASGMNARIYYHPDQNTYVLCFRGSEVEPRISVRDWVTDLINAYEPPEWIYSFQNDQPRVARQYARALALAAEFATIPSSRLVVTGHSLGGGLASASGPLFTGLETFTFNAAGIRPDVMYRHLAPTVQPQLIRAYYSDGEILSALQDGEFGPVLTRHVPPALGVRTVVPSPLTVEPLRASNSVEILRIRGDLHSLGPLIRMVGKIREQMIEGT